MKKNLIIVILSIVSVVSIVFAVYEQTIATRLKMEAEAAATEAVKQATIAKMNAVDAIKQKEVADIARRMLAEELAKGKKGK